MSAKNNTASGIQIGVSLACKKSSSENLLLKREQEFEQAKKALEDARQKRALELGNLCLEFGFHKENMTLLRQKFAELTKTLPGDTEK